MSLESVLRPLFSGVRLLYVLVVLMCVAMCAPTKAHAKVVVKMEPNTYIPIHGRTAEDLGYAIHKRMITFNGAEHALAVTEMRLESTLRCRKVATGFVATDVLITMYMHYIYPSWKSRDYAEPGVVEKWDQFMSMLVVHEEMGHGQINIEMVNEIDRVLTTMKPQASCEAVKSYVDTAFALITKKHDARHKKFDQGDDSSQYIYTLFPSFGQDRDLTKVRSSPHSGNSAQ